MYARQTERERVMEGGREVERDREREGDGGGAGGACV